MGDGSQALPFNSLGETNALVVDSDVIEVAAGTYVEDLVINRSIQINAPAGPDSTFLVSAGTGMSAAVQVDASVGVVGLTFTGVQAPNKPSILVSFGNGITLVDCIVRDNVSDG